MASGRLAASGADSAKSPADDIHIVSHSDQFTRSAPFWSIVEYTQPHDDGVTDTEAKGRKHRDAGQ